MFKIEDGREFFYQWDLDRRLVVNDDISEVHFCNRTDDCSLVCETYVEDGIRLVNVPNIVLQNDFKIRVYGYDKYYTKYEKCFEVQKRTKPSDYAYTETEILNWSKIEEKVDLALEEIKEVEEVAELVLSNAQDATEKAINATLGLNEIVQEANSTIDNANDAANNAYTAGEEANRAVENMNSTFTNALKGEASGSSVSIGDVSPLPHTVKVSTEATSVNIKGANLFDVYSAIRTSSNSTCSVEVLGSGNIKTVILKKGSPQYATATIEIPVAKAGTVYLKTKAICSSAELTKPELHIRFTNSASGAYTTKKIFTNITTEWSEIVYTLNISSSDLEKYDRLMLLMYVKNSSVDVYNVGEYVELKDIMVSEYDTEYKPYTSTDYEVVDGIANVHSIYPVMNISTDTEETINVEYNRDINKAFAELQQVIISLGGNI